MLTMALAKGRMLAETRPLLSAAGIELDNAVEDGRKLTIGTNQPDLSVVLVRAADVATYVQYGAADLGITGKDLLMEQASADLYELLDLGVSRCRMVVAAPAENDGDERPGGRVRVATKYVNICRAYFAQRGIQAEIIKLYGSMELAPHAGLCDCIVDLVESGATLKANGLVEMEQVAEVSARLIANRASMKIHHDRITRLCETLADASSD